MIRLGQTYQFKGSLANQFVFVVVEKTAERDPDNPDHMNNPVPAGWRLLILSGFFQHTGWPNAPVHDAGSILFVADSSAIACDAEPF